MYPQKTFFFINIRLQKKIYVQTKIFLFFMIVIKKSIIMLNTRKTQKKIENEKRENPKKTREVAFEVN